MSQPSIIMQVRNADPSVRDEVLEQLAKVVGMLKLHVRDFMGEIFSIIALHWHARSDSTIQTATELVVGTPTSLQSAVPANHLIPSRPPSTFTSILKLLDQILLALGSLETIFSANSSQFFKTD